MNQCSQQSSSSSGGRTSRNLTPISSNFHNHHKKETKKETASDSSSGEKKIREFFVEKLQKIQEGEKRGEVMNQKFISSSPLRRMTNGSHLNTSPSGGAAARLTSEVEKTKAKLLFTPATTTATLSSQKHDEQHDRGATTAISNRHTTFPAAGSIQRKCNANNNTTTHLDQDRKKAEVVTSHVLFKSCEKTTLEEDIDGDHEGEEEEEINLAETQSSLYPNQLKLMMAATSHLRYHIRVDLQWLRLMNQEVVNSLAALQRISSEIIALNYTYTHDATDSKKIKNSKSVKEDDHEDANVEIMNGNSDLPKFALVGVKRKRSEVEVAEGGDGGNSFPLLSSSGDEQRQDEKDNDDGRKEEAKKKKRRREIQNSLKIPPHQKTVNVRNNEDCEIKMNFNVEIQSLLPKLAPVFQKVLQEIIMGNHHPHEDSADVLQRGSCSRIFHLTTTPSEESEGEKRRREGKSAKSSSKKDKKTKNKRIVEGRQKAGTVGNRYQGKNFSSNETESEDDIGQDQLKLLFLLKQHIYYTEQVRQFTSAAETKAEEICQGAAILNDWVQLRLANFEANLQNDLYQRLAGCVYVYPHHCQQQYFSDAQLQDFRNAASTNVDEHDDMNAEGDFKTFFWPSFLCPPPHQHRSAICSTSATPVRLFSPSQTEHPNNDDASTSSTTNINQEKKQKNNISKNRSSCDEKKSTTTDDNGGNIQFVPFSYALQIAKEEGRVNGATEEREDEKEGRIGLEDKHVEVEVGKAVRSRSHSQMSTTIAGNTITISRQPSESKNTSSKKNNKEKKKWNPVEEEQKQFRQVFSPSRDLLLPRKKSALSNERLLKILLYELNIQEDDWIFVHWRDADTGGEYVWRGRCFRIVNDPRGLIKRPARQGHPKTKAITTQCSLKSGSHLIEPLEEKKDNVEGKKEEQEQKTENGKYIKRERTAALEVKVEEALEEVEEERASWQLSPRPSGLPEAKASVDSPAPRFALQLSPAGKQQQEEGQQAVVRTEEKPHRSESSTEKQQRNCREKGGARESNNREKKFSSAVPEFPKMEQQEKEEDNEKLNKLKQKENHHQKVVAAATTTTTRDEVVVVFKIAYYSLHGDIPFLSAEGEEMRWELDLPSLEKGVEILEVVKEQDARNRASMLYVPSSLM